MLGGKHILLGVTGGIAAYKTAELVRAFVKAGSRVKVIMTRNGSRFVTPLALETLSGEKVYGDTFDLTYERDITHVTLAEWADITIIAPATANIMAKIAWGIADDLLSTTVIALKSPLLICPSMNTDMYKNPVVRRNMDQLKGLGYHLLEAKEGELACKTHGSGRLPPLEDIVEAAETVLTKKDLEGVNILVTAGPTQEPLDPVRYITNHSSGKMGYALALMAKRRGACVTLISGPVSIPVPAGVELVSVITAREMRDAVLSRLEGHQVIIKAAAVSDYRPAGFSQSKIKKGVKALTLELEPNPDIIAEVGRLKGHRILVGFAMETEHLLENARKKMAEKKMDIIVANDLSEPGAGFRHDTNAVRILDPEGGVESLPLMEKKEVADRILDKVVELLKRRKLG